MTYLEEYCTKVLTGEIVACKRIKQVCKMLYRKLQFPSIDEYYFDEERANRPIEFIETFCKTPTGQVGTPLKLQLFQKARLQAVFGFVHKAKDPITGFEFIQRQYNEVMIMEGRKNGKSTELAALALYLLIADGEGSPNIYCVATKYDQAKISFDEAHKMIKQSPDLTDAIVKRKSDLYFPYNFGKIQPLASNTKSLDGLNAHGAILDEMAAMQNRDVYDLIKQSIGNRQQPLIFAITTNGFVRENIFDAQYQYSCDILDGIATNPNFLPFLYELDTYDEWDDENAWVKANPGLGTIKRIDVVRQNVQKAKDDPTFKATVMTKDFNMKQNSATAWLRWESLNNTELVPTDYVPRYVIGGFDGAETTDLMSARILYSKPAEAKLYSRSMYWLPEETLLERERNDKIPYSLWEKQGLLRVCPGNRCTFDYALEWFKELRKDEGIYTLWIGYDPWHMDQSTLQSFKNEFGPDSMIPIRQGAITLSSPMKALGAELDAKRVVYNNNPIDKWCLSNTEVKVDINNNIQPVKLTDKRKRIDGTLSLLDAYVVYLDKKDMYETLL